MDVRDSTAVQHRTALGRLLPVLGDRTVESITAGDVAEFVGKLAADGYARESIRKSVTALAMVLDCAGVQPNPARDRVQVRLPRQEPEEPEPPTAEHVEAVARLFPPAYRLALLSARRDRLPGRRACRGPCRHLFDRQRHADHARAALEARFGNILETTGRNGRENGPVPGLAEVASLGEKRTGGN